jgi:uncharacterized protein involved in exopolysaccharide biosynthesis
MSHIEKVKDPYRQESEEPFDEGIDLLDYLEVVVKRRWWIILITCVSAAVFVADELSTKTQSTYVAEANAFISNLRKIDPGQGRISVSNFVDIAVLKHAQVSKRVLERTMPCLVRGVQDSVVLWDYLAEGRTMRGALDALSGAVHFRQDGRSSDVTDGEAHEMLTLTATMGDPLVATATANAFLEELIRYYTEIGQAGIRRDIEFLDARLLTLEQELKEAEDSLLVFKRRHRGRLNQLDIIDDLELEYTWKQRLVSTRAKLYGSLLNEREMSRLQVGRSQLEFEVINLARVKNVTQIRQSMTSLVGMGVGVGLLIGLLLVFLAEFLSLQRRSGNLERLARAYRGDT